jgi:hypothetical protein
VALGLKAVFVVTTLAGGTGLWPAVLADTGATVLVTLNALRLLRWQSMPRLATVTRTSEVNYGPPGEGRFPPQGHVDRCL